MKTSTREFIQMFFGMFLFYILVSIFFYFIEIIFNIGSDDNILELLFICFILTIITFLVVVIIGGFGILLSKIFNRK